VERVETPVFGIVARLEEASFLELVDSASS
jgi:hypothetical protein